MGRKRKPLKEKSTSIFLNIDNYTLFAICEQLNIQVNENAEFFDDETIKEMKKELLRRIKQSEGLTKCVGSELNV